MRCRCALDRDGFAGTRETAVPAGSAKLSEYHAAVGLAALDECDITRAEWMTVAGAYRSRFSEFEPVQASDCFGKSWIASTCLFGLGALPRLRSRKGIGKLRDRNAPMVGQRRPSPSGDDRLPANVSPVDRSAGRFNYCAAVLLLRCPSSAIWRRTMSTGLLSASLIWPAAETARNKFADARLVLKVRLLQCSSRARSACFSPRISERINGQGSGSKVT